MINAYTEPLKFTIFDGSAKTLVSRRGHELRFSARYLAPGSEVQVIGSKYVVKPRSIAVLTQ